MALLSVAELEEHIGLQTDLQSGALERLMLGAEQAIVRRHGPHTGPVTERYRAWNDEFMLNRCRTPVRRPMSAITTIRLNGTILTGDARPVIDTDARWLYWEREELEGTVLATYTPLDDQDTRKIMVVDLVRVALRDLGLKVLAETGIRQVSVDPKKRRKEILSRLDYWGDEWYDVWA